MSHDWSSLVYVTNVHKEDASNNAKKEDNRGKSGLSCRAATEGEAEGDSPEWH